jgi:hypothetical protein
VLASLGQRHDVILGQWGFLLAVGAAMLVKSLNCLPFSVGQLANASAALDGSATLYGGSAQRSCGLKVGHIPLDRLCPGESPSALQVICIPALACLLALICVVGAVGLEMSFPGFWVLHDPAPVGFIALSFVLLVVSHFVGFAARLAFSTQPSLRFAKELRGCRERVVALGAATLSHRGRN